MDHFNFVSNHTSVRAQQRNEQLRRDVVTRSITRQQTSLSAQSESSPTLLSTNANPDRERWENVVGTNVDLVYSTMSDIPCLSSSNYRASPRR